MTVEDLAKNTVWLLAEKVRLYFACSMLPHTPFRQGTAMYYHSGDNDEQEKKPEKLWAAQIRGLGPDHVHNYKLDPGRGEECQHGVHDLEAEEEGCH